MIDPVATDLAGTDRTAESRACSRAAWDFSRFEELWAKFSPLTPLGKDVKERRRVLCDRAALERAYDGCEALLSRPWLKRKDAVLDRITYHLRRLPRLPFDSPRPAEAGSLDLIEVFQVKKFLANYGSARLLLDEGLRELFGLRFESGDLAAELDRGGSDPETFYVADSYHVDLPVLRAAIAGRDAALRVKREEARAAALRDRGLDFAGRDFLVMPYDEARKLLERTEGPGYIVEAYDGRSCVVRLQESEGELLLEEERDALLAMERAAEAEVLARLSVLVSSESERLIQYAEALREFDLALARAALAGEFGLVRPDLGSQSLIVDAGRFLPCEWECARLGTRYAPLNANIGERSAVLFGSNMGGKTVALQSLLFFQIAAQAGLFVPAAAFGTSVYRVLEYVGEQRAERAAGLSGFGFEIRAFVGAWRAAAAHGAFLVFDEFARTTSSLEAEAILSAAIESLAAMEGSRSLFSTHFRGVARLKGTRYLRMCGLDLAAASAIMEAELPLEERIRRINRMMRYELIEDSGEADRGSDAVAIASLLGLDGKIVARAGEFYRGDAGRNPETRDNEEI